MFITMLCLSRLGFAGEEALGTMGGTTTLGAGWKREAISPSLGPDQFHDDHGVYLYVRETRGIYLDESDVTRALRTTAVGIESKGGKATDEVKVDRRGTVYHAQQGYLSAFNGVKVEYSLHFIGQGGLGYLFMVWNQQGHSLQLQRAAREVTGRFKMPGASSPWAAEMAPRTDTYTVAEHVIDFSYSPAELQSVPVEKGADTFAALQAADESMAAYFFVEKVDFTTEQMLDFAVEKTGADATEVTRVTRTDRTLSGIPSRVAMLEGKAGGGDYSGAVAVIPLGSKQYLDVRLFSYGSLASRSALFERVIRSVQVRHEPTIDAFPRPAPQPAPDELTAAMHKLLDPAKRLGELGWGQAWRRVGNAVFVQQREQIATMDLTSGTSGTYAIGEETATRLPVAAADGVLVPNAAGEVMKVTATGVAPAGFNARFLADGGAAGLLVARSPTAVDVVGFAPMPGAEGATLWARAADGTERRLTTFPESTVLALEATGEVALLAVSGPANDDYAYTLFLVSTKDGTKRNLGDWAYDSTISADPAGFLVTGKPPGEGPGVYRITPDGTRTQVVSGAHEGAIGFDGDLVLATQFNTEATPSGAHSLSAYRVPAAVVSAEGQNFDPLSTARLQQIAAKTLAGADPQAALRDAAAVRALVAAANKESLARFGAPLPRDAAGVNRLLRAAVGDESLKDEGYVLLAAILGEHLLAQGAVWVDSPAPAKPSLLAAPYVKENAHALGYLPLGLVRSELQDSEGWYDSATWVVENANGRLLVLGTDPTAVRTRVDAAPRGDLAALDNKSTAEIIAWLQVEKQNVYLRDEVYLRLVAAGRVKELDTIAAPFLTATPEEADLRAALAARVARADVSDKTLVADLKAAVGRFSRSDGFYMLLGAAYEAAGGPDAKVNAGACYQEILKVHKYGFFADAATAALARLQ